MLLDSYEYCKKHTDYYMIKLLNKYSVITIDYLLSNLYIKLFFQFLMGKSFHKNIEEITIVLQNYHKIEGFMCRVKKIMDLEIKNR